MSINYLIVHNICNFEKIISSPIFIGCDKKLLHMEITTNMWALSIASNMIKDISVDNLLEFIKTLLYNKTKQISQLNLSCSAIFYMWFDEMAAQLRFSIISDFNRKLPFGCKINIIDSPNQILMKFLQSQYNPEISWKDLEEVTNNSDDIEENTFTLDVFVIQLN